MNAERQAKEEAPSVNSNGFFSRCFLEVCSGPMNDKSHSNDPQKVDMFLGRNVQTYQGYQDGSSCNRLSSPVHRSRAISGDNVDRLLAAEMNSLTLKSVKQCLMKFMELPVQWRNLHSL